ncbi:hypothetical protein [Myxococcus sp. AB056]|uniref:hypothetical protein n=1 Tax=Myxococcus sp. AB056 TaxID=2562792 RepID=UPI001E351418|nr:hypothetical protein [Myxococcus sp. AB056]
MLRIRPEQMALMNAQGRERFIAETLQSLPSVFPGDARLQDARALRGAVEDGITHAERHGITDAREVTLYVFLFIEFGPGFEKAPATRWMGDLLMVAQRPASEKLNLIYARLELAQARQGKG